MLFIDSDPQAYLGLTSKEKKYCEGNDFSRKYTPQGIFFLMHDNLGKNKKDLSMLINKNTAAALELLV